MDRDRDKLVIIPTAIGIFLLSYYYQPKKKHSQWQIQEGSNTYIIIDGGGGWWLLYGTATVGFVVAELFSTFANPMHILEHPIWLIYLICTVAIVVCRRFTQRYLWWLYVDGYWLCLLDCDYGLKLHQIRPGINKGASSVGSGAIIRQCYYRAPVKWAISKQIQSEITVTRLYTFRLIHTGADPQKSLLLTHRRARQAIRN